MTKPSCETHVQLDLEVIEVRLMASRYAMLNFAITARKMADALGIPQPAPAERVVVAPPKNQPHGPVKATRKGKVKRW